MRLSDLRPGAVFITTGGTMAVKSEYHYPDGAPECVLLASGEYAHFPNKGAEEVTEVPLDAVGYWGCGVCNGTWPCPDHRMG